MSQFTDAQLVEQYLQLKAYVASRSEVFDAEMKPYKDGMATIENAFLARLNERGAENTKTDAGTAYKSTLLNVKVVDRDALLEFCTGHWQDIGSEMLQAGASKDAVKTYLDKSGGEPPPGVEIAYFTRVNIRRT